MMVALPQLMDPPPRLPEGVADLVNDTASATRERKVLLDEALAVLARRERELEEVEQFVAGLAGLDLDAEQGSAPDEEVVANAVEVIEELFAWAATVAEERSDQLNALKDALEDLCAGEEALASLARQVYLRQEALSGRIQALARQDMENLIGNMLHQVARQRELSIDEKIRLLHSIPDHRPIDNPVSTRRADWYSDSDSTHRRDWYR